MDPDRDAAGDRMEQREWNNTNMHGETRKKGKQGEIRTQCGDLTKRGVCVCVCVEGGCFLTHVNAQCLLSCQTE